MPQWRYSNANTGISYNNSGGGGGHVDNAGSVRQPQPQEQAQQVQHLRRYPDVVDSDSDPDELSNASGDSFPPERRMGFGDRKRVRRVEVGGPRGGECGKSQKKGKEKEKEKKGGVAVKKWGSSVRELTMAIWKFGEAYEAAERKKLQHLKEMEMQRMKFEKELELQRIKFMMKTQIELSQWNANGNGNCNVRIDNDSRGGRSVSVRVGESNSHHARIHENHVNHDTNSDSSN